MINSQSSRKQQGVTLVFSLVILVSLTMIGLTSMQSTQTELAMAGNQRESDFMFQAAEMGLVSAENFVETSPANADFAQSNLGLYTVNATEGSYESVDYFKKAKWDNSSQLAKTNIYGLNVNEQPRYIIEYLGDRDNNPAKLGGGIDYGDPDSSKIVSIYRATSRGRGLTGNSYRYVQSYYGKDVN
jgi:type IV pilus assembly protein PilX